MSWRRTCNFSHNRFLTAEAERPNFEASGIYRSGSSTQTRGHLSTDDEGNMELTFKQFSPRSHPELFHPYLELMYKVFISEQGWKIDSNHRRKKVEMTLEDIHSVFVVALDLDNNIVGGIKGTLPSFYFPDESLYGQYLKNGELDQCRDAISVVKSLVVTSEYRQRCFIIDGQEKSLGQALIEKLMVSLSGQGAKLVFGSPTVYEAGILMMKCGFNVIDNPVPFDGPSRSAVNMAWSNDQLIRGYFRSREVSLLKSSEKRKFFLDSLKSSAKSQKKIRATA